MTGPASTFTSPVALPARCQRRPGSSLGGVLHVLEGEIYLRWSSAACSQTYFDQCMDPLYSGKMTDTRTQGSFIHSFIHPPNKVFLRAHYVSDTVLHDGASAVTKQTKVLAFWNLGSSGEKDNKRKLVDFKVR